MESLGHRGCSFSWEYSCPKEYLGIRWICIHRDMWVAEPPGLCQEISELKFLLDGKDGQCCKEHLGKKHSLSSLKYRIFVSGSWGSALLVWSSQGHISWRRNFAQGDTLVSNWAQWDLEDARCERQDMRGSQGCLENQGQYFWGK